MLCLLKITVSGSSRSMDTKGCSSSRGIEGEVAAGGTVSTIFIFRKFGMPKTRDAPWSCCCLVVCYRSFKWFIFL